MDKSIVCSFFGPPCIQKTLKCKPQLLVIFPFSSHHMEITYLEGWVTRGKVADNFYLRKASCTPADFGTDISLGLGLSYTVLLGNSGISKNKGTTTLLAVQ